MFDDVGAVEIDVFDQRAAIFTIENDVLVFSRRATSLDHNADRVRGTDRRMWSIRRNKERLSLAHEMIDDAVAFADANFDTAFELIKIFFRVAQVKIVPRVRPLDHHHKK